ncbi:hypothetical protein ACFSKL_00140 [Belliella marina]|uniref:Outer membrane protein beta-barrel domain-containing protein n=1 Tax=Belliella marina TaxID=1644146 RepID=A0ABW4VHB8_9BACT
MKEQFDKKLADKIKDSFANHSEPYDSSQWEKLSAVYFKPKAANRKPIWIWMASGIAACLVIGLLVFPQFSEMDLGLEDQLSMVDSVGINHTEEKSPVGSKQIEDPKIQINEMPSNKIDEEVRLAKKNDFEKEINSSEIIGDQKANPKIVGAPSVSKLVESPLVAELKTEKALDLTSDPIQSEVEKELVETPEIELKSSLLAEKPDNAQELINQWLNEGENGSGESSDAKAVFDKAMRLGVILAPQTISNNTQSMNMGAGILSEFSFSKRLKLDVGVAYARQTINPSVNNELRSANNMQHSPVDYMQNSTDDQRMLAFSNNFVNASYELSFGQLEIPLNLKYKVMDNKSSDIYLITGLSNMVYMNQKNVGTFTTANFMTAGLVQDQQNVQTFTETATPSSTNSGSDMSVGQMLNFSLGYEYNLKNGTFLSLEPFYKTSIGGQTFINQQFAIGGLNLRMNFQFKKQ